MIDKIETWIKWVAVVAILLLFIIGGYFLLRSQTLKSKSAVHLEYVEMKYMEQY